MERPLAFNSPVSAYLDRLHSALLGNTEGAVADYIPELSKADPASFGIAIATMDGVVYESGNTQTQFSIQSMSKPFTFGQALTELGKKTVLGKVGVEPTGEAFNSIVLDDVHNRPFNPMVNAGAISIANLLCRDGAEDDVLDLFSRLAGRPLEIDEAIFQSELATGHRNRAIAYMMLNTGMIDNPPEVVLDLYFKQCSINVNCHDMAMMAATLANLGEHPRTGDTVFSAGSVQDVLTLMSTCGMYDYAGQWAYDVGFAAKSGVSGGIIAVIPGQAGIAVWSPPLDAHGNSVRGVEVCKSISREFGLHGFSEKALPGTVIRNHHRANEVGSMRIRSSSERAWLTEHGHRISVTELQGALYFGSTETIIRVLAEAASEVDEMVVDFRRVGFTDAASIRLLTQAFVQFHELGCALSLGGLDAGGPLKELRAKLVESCPWATWQNYLDAAVQSAEDRLLEGHYELRDNSVYSLANMPIFEGLERDDIKRLEGIVNTVSYSKGQKIVSEGDAANAFFVIASGFASVSIELPRGRPRRLASLGPGSTFGEMALIESGTRTANVFADQPVFAYLFSLDGIRDLSRDRPNILTTILSNITKELAQRLRKANEEIRNLE